MKSTLKKNPAAVALGKLGGAAGRGKSKRRSRAHYRAAGLKGLKARYGTLSPQ